ncbi:MAG: hypothetical protein PHT40_01480 [Patescibacteria group bacterium]|nr:hypothetical protein [Patescibacteria group bacterium]
MKLKLKSGEIFAVVVMAVMLTIGLGIASARAQATKPDTIKVEFALGSSVIPNMYKAKLIVAKEKIANGWTAEISAGANLVGWVDENKNQSDARDGGKIVMRARSVAKALGLKSFKPGVLTTDEKIVLVVLTPPSTSSVSQEEQPVSLPVPPDSSALNCSLLLGWQGASCGNARDLSVMSAGLKFSYKRVFVNVQGGLNPWSAPGYKKLWYRDYLGSANVGYVFKQADNWNFYAQVGGLIGWEATSETNRFSLQILGSTAGVGVEKRISKHISLRFGADYLRAETSDITPYTGRIRDGIVGSGVISITF